MKITGRALIVLSLIVAPGQFVVRQQYLPRQSSVIRAPWRAILAPTAWSRRAAVGLPYAASRW